MKKKEKLAHIIVKNQYIVQNLKKNKYKLMINISRHRDAYTHVRRT